MKALILSCNTGGGHNSAARAIAEEMQDRGDEAYVLDYLCLAGEGVSKLVGDGYVQIVKRLPDCLVPLISWEWESANLRKNPRFIILTEEWRNIWINI